ncbi:MAG: MarR family winged helix-turn-helix transcriptional regulator [Bacteroidales bacterium]|nr:MarR family winged helix-turn-helix transcriptional regulator [Bacteroidales bacterium]
MNLSPVAFEILFALLSVKVSSAINRKLYRKFREAGIEVTPEQWTVMHYLWTKDGVTQQELCTHTFKDKPSMTRLIDNLVKAGFVNRQASPLDRRINLIYLTEKGKMSEAKIQPVVTENIKSALDGVSDQEFLIIQSALSKIFSNIKSSLKV